MMRISPTTPPTTVPMFTFAFPALGKREVGVYVDVDANAVADDNDGDVNVNVADEVPVANTDRK